MERLKIELKDIEKVSIKVAYKPGKTFAKYYTCNTTITAKGKDYTKKYFHHGTKNSSSRQSLKPLSSLKQLSLTA